MWIPFVSSQVEEIPPITAQSESPTSPLDTTLVHSLLHFPFCKMYWTLSMTQYTLYIIKTYNSINKKSHTKITVPTSCFHLYIIQESPNKFQSFYVILKNITFLSLNFFISKCHVVL